MSFKTEVDDVAEAVQRLKEIPPANRTVEMDVLLSLGRCMRASLETNREILGEVRITNGKVKANTAKFIEVESRIETLEKIRASHDKEGCPFAQSLATQFNTAQDSRRKAIWKLTAYIFAIGTVAGIVSTSLGLAFRTGLIVWGNQPIP